MQAAGRISPIMVFILIAIAASCGTENCDCRDALCSLDSLCRQEACPDAEARMSDSGGPDQDLPAPDLVVPDVELRDLADDGTGSPDQQDPPVCDDWDGEPLPMTMLRAREGMIVDEFGRQVLLRGINVSSVEKLDEAQMDAMGFFGFNATRLVLTWELLEPQRDQVDQEFLEYVDHMLAMHEERGMYALLDMHQGFWSVWGMPDWTCDLSYDGHDMESSMLCAQQFFPNEELVGRFHDIWKLLAQRYRDRVVVLGYDLINEPPPYDLMGGLSGDFDRDVLHPFYEELVAAIRTVDPDHMAFIEPNFFTGLGPNGLHEPFADDNMVFAPHVYTPHEYSAEEGWHNVLEPTITLLEGQIGEFLGSAADMGVPMCIGEWGSIQEDPLSGGWLNAAIFYLEEFHISSLIWAFGAHNRNFAVFNEDNQPNEIFREYLLRPFVHAIGARDFYFHSDNWSGFFDLSFPVEPESACLITELVLPKALYSYTPEFQVVEGDAELRYLVNRQRLLIRPKCSSCTITIHSR